MGDVVLVHDTTPRSLWNPARITKLISGQDGRVRGAILKVIYQGKKAHTLKHPLQHLYPLDTPKSSSDEIVEGLFREKTKQQKENLELLNDLIDL